MAQRAFEYWDDRVSADTWTKTWSTSYKDETDPCADTDGWVTHWEWNGPPFPQTETGRGRGRKIPVVSVLHPMPTRRSVPRFDRRCNNTKCVHPDHWEMRVHPADVKWLERQLAKES